MTPHIHRLLELQNRNADLSEQGLSSSYMVVLNHLWNGRYASAADAASAAVVEDPEHMVAPKLYRSWIESLSQLGDNESLADLAQHLLDRGREEPELKQTWMALRGIIHVELDQAPMARLMARSIHGRVNNQYCLEFEQLCARRGFSDTVYPIVQAAGNVDDYFVWNTLLQDLAGEGQREALNDCLKHVNRVFPGSPAQEFFSLHLAVEHGHWPAAMNHASKLRELFADHPDYAFSEAYAAYRGNDIDRALKVLDAIDADRRYNDVDLLSLTGECLAAKAKRDENDDAAKRAVDVLTRAAKLKRRYGLAVDQTVDLIRELEDRVGGSTVANYSANQFREPRSWLVMLSPRRSNEMLESSDQHSQVLHRPMGTEAAPGDIVLFVTRAAHVAKKSLTHKNEWRLLSMYRVTSRPYWHPVHRWHSSLELIDRPEHPVPIDAQDVKSDIDVRGKRASLPRGHHARFGVYGLDESAMDIMIAAVKRRTEGVDHRRDRRGEHLSKQKPV